LHAYTEVLLENFEHFKAQSFAHKISSKAIKSSQQLLQRNKQKA